MKYNSSYWEIRGFLLWFAFKIVPLVYEIQPHKEYCYTRCVVICFQNRTFGIWNTTYFSRCEWRWSCDLLSKSYLWYMKYNLELLDKCEQALWFAFKIVPLVYEIQLPDTWLPYKELWFAFKIVPLVYEIQHGGNYAGMVCCCDLLSKSYLWYMKYNAKRIWNRSIVLWFAFKIVPLVYEIQLSNT